MLHRHLTKSCFGGEGDDNGEYLSQGEVHHTGRSCVFSLDQLVQAGLHDLEWFEGEVRCLDGAD